MPAEHDPQAPSRSTRDVIHLFGGGIFVLIIVGVVAAAFLTKGRVTAVDTEIRPDVVLAAQDAGIDLTGGLPSGIATRLLAAAESPLAVDISAVEWRGERFLDRETSAPITGYVVTRDLDDHIRTVCTVVEGELNGSTVDFYRPRVDGDGSQNVERVRRYVSGGLAGQIIEYYPSGRMRLRAVAGPPDQSGGTSVTQISLLDSENVREGEGQASIDLGSGRLQFLHPDGSTTITNEQMRPDTVTGFMLFQNKSFGRQEPVVPDSRKLLEPTPSEG